MQIYKTAEQDGRVKEAAGSKESEGLTVVHIPKVHELQGTEDDIFQKVKNNPAGLDLRRSFVLC